MEAARELFAVRGIEGVSFREIARVAGVDHALVHRYFPDKSDMVVEIVRSEAASIVEGAVVPASLDREVALEAIRTSLRRALVDHRAYMVLIMRAELDGLHLEDLVPNVPTLPLRLLVEGIREARRASGEDQSSLPDPALLSAVVVGAAFSLVALAPWLLAGAGLKPEDFGERQDELVDILVDIVSHFGGG